MLRRRPLRAKALQARWRKMASRPPIGMLAIRVIHVMARVNNPPAVGGRFALWPGRIKSSPCRATQVYFAVPAGPAVDVFSTNRPVYCTPVYSVSPMAHAPTQLDGCGLSVWRIVRELGYMSRCCIRVSSRLRIAAPGEGGKWSACDRFLNLKAATFETRDKPRGSLRHDMSLKQKWPECPLEVVWSLVVNDRENSFTTDFA